MSLTVTQRPQISYLSGVSTWNAVRNPIIYRMIRRDFTYNQSNNNGGFMQMQFTGVDITAQFSIGDSVYADTRGNGIVTAVAFSGGNTLVTLDQTFTTSSTGHVTNFTKRAGYRVEVELYNIDDVLLGQLSASPNPQGLLYFDVATILKANLIPDLGSLPEAVMDDTNAYTGFYIKYTEVWTGSAESQTDDTANRFYAALAALQIPSAYGGNMALYAEGQTKFLTKLDQPVMWRGYPFLLSAIVGENVGSNVYIDNGTNQSVSENLAGKLVHFDLNEIIVDQSINETDVALFEDTSGPIQLSETLTIELRDACEKPILLVGRNSLGGVLTWMFDVNQESSFSHKNGMKNKTLRLLTEDITINQWEALNDFFGLGEVYRNNIIEFTSSTIKTSSRIGSQVYTIDADGNKIGVVVVPRELTTETKQIKHRFEVEIEYPETFL